jgi:hypothetical protein
MATDIGAGTAIKVETGYFDLLLGALSYLTDGAWSTFERAADAIADTQADEPPQARDAARALTALGHIDVMVDRRSTRPTRWSVAPPTLIRLPSDSSWLLCGRRSDRLLHTLASAAENAGAACSLTPMPNQPARVLLISSGDGRGAEASQIAEVAMRAASAGHEIHINVETAATLARALPPLSDVIERLQRLTPAAGGRIERLEPDGRGGLAWRLVGDFAQPGSYRFDPPPLTYVYVDEHAALPARVDARLARLLALLEAGAPPLAWDPATGVASAVYWAEPPTLYERALALCSGVAPRSTLAERRTDYDDVPEEVAAVIYARLHAWEPPA